MESDFISKLITSEDLMNEINSFINDNSAADISKLRIKYLSSGVNHSYSRDFYEFAILQIEARKRFKRKFPTLYNDLFFSSLLSGEQASAEKIADYHALLAVGYHSLLDLTAGLGIDFMQMLNRGLTKVRDNQSIGFAFELDRIKAETLRLNLKNRNIHECEVIISDSISGLQLISPPTPTLIFVDPDRRGNHGERLYDPSDCQPDVIHNFQLIKSKADRLIIKNSPMLDVSKAFELFPDLSELHIVSLHNECKEVLIICDFINPSDSEIKIVCVNILDNGMIEEFVITKEEFTHRAEGIKFIKGNEFENWLNKGNNLFLYEPDASIMKAGIWRCIQDSYPLLLKADNNTHLFLSKEFYSDFPGRITRIVRIINKSDRKDLKNYPINIVTKNYPCSADSLMKTLKTTPLSNNSKFLYALTIDSQRFLLETHSVNNAGHS